jgi:Bacterial SH3 domain
MKARIVDQAAILRTSPGLTSAAIAELPADSEVELGQVKSNAGTRWVSVSLLDGRSGYVPGDTKVFIFKRATLLQDRVDVYAGPSEDSGVVTRCQKNDRFQMTGNVTRDGKTWVKIRDAAGTEGYIDGGTRVRTETQAAMESPQHAMLHGALWCIGGILVTTITYSLASDHGGTYLIAWGPVIFGGWRFLKGLFRSVAS